MEKHEPTIERAKRLSSYIEELTDAELVCLFQDLYAMQADVEQLLVLARDEANTRSYKKEAHERI